MNSNDLRSRDKNSEYELAENVRENGDLQNDINTITKYTIAGMYIYMLRRRAFMSSLADLNN